MGLDAEPVQSLSDVADQFCHAALLTQRLHDRVQLLEEFYGRKTTRLQWRLPGGIFGGGVNEGGSKS